MSASTEDSSDGYDNVEGEELTEEQNKNTKWNSKRSDANLVAWRKEKVFTLWAKGWPQSRIAAELQCAQSTVSEDLTFLLKQSQDNLEHHLNEGIPKQWAQCSQGLKTVLTEGWNIYDTISGDASVRTTDKTAILALIKDCYKNLLDLNADSTIVSECINFSKRANNKLQSLQPEQQTDSGSSGIPEQPAEVEGEGDVDTSVSHTEEDVVEQEQKQ